MKQVNEFRHTDKFCVVAIHAKHLGVLAEHYGRNLNSVAHDGDALDTYTVRVWNSRDGLWDERVKVEYNGKVTVLERVQIAGPWKTLNLELKRDADDFTGSPNVSKGVSI